MGSDIKAYLSIRNASKHFSSNMNLDYFINRPVKGLVILDKSLMKCR